MVLTQQERPGTILLLTTYLLVLTLSVQSLAVIGLSPVFGHPAFRQAIARRCATTNTLTGALQHHAKMVCNRSCASLIYFRNYGTNASVLR